MVRSDVFISHASEDRALADTLARSLEARGFSVFADPKILVGERFSDRIEQELENASCVVVLFTLAGVRSRRVLNEAYYARERNARLIPVVVGNAEVPLAFRGIHSIPFPENDPQGFQGLADDITSALFSDGIRGLGSPSPELDVVLERGPQAGRRRRAVWASLFVVSLAVLLGLWAAARLPLSMPAPDIPALFFERRILLSLLASVGVGGLTWFAIQRLRRSTVSRTRSPSRIGLESVTPSSQSSSPDPLSRLAREFFEAAGRTVNEVAKEELRIPEPVVLLRESLTSADVDRLSSRFGSFASGFFVYRDKLRGDVEDAVTRLRVKGRAIGALSDRLMRAALDDGRTKQALAEIEREASGNDNLFRTKNALLLPRYFFGREQLLAELGQMLARGEHVLLLGTRKCGKTSCLNMLRQALVEYPIATVDLQRYDRNQEDWHRSLFAELLSAYDRWAEARFGRWPFGREEPDTGTKLHEALRKRHEWVQESGDAKALIVILDEFERVMPREGEKDAARRFVLAVGALRNLGQGENRLISLIGADLRPDSNRVNLLPNGETNPIFGLLHEMPLRPLERNQIRDMVKFIAGKMGVQEVTKEFVGELQRLSGGHAYLCRLLAAAAYDAREKSEKLLARHIASGLEALNDEGEVTAFLDQNFWGPLTAREQSYLEAIANGNTPPDDEVARGSLNQQSLCIKNRIPIELFRDWIRRRTPSTKTVPAT